MKLDRTLKIIKIAEVNDFKAGHPIKLEDIKTLNTPETINCTIHDRLEDLELKEDKSYPGLNKYENYVSDKYKDFHKIKEDGENLKLTLTPIYVMNIKRLQMKKMLDFFLYHANICV